MSPRTIEHFLLVYNLPLSGNSRKADRGGVEAVIEDPDTALAGGHVLQNGVRLIAAIPVWPETLSPSEPRAM
jgi:hypothetical protein